MRESTNIRVGNFSLNRLTQNYGRVAYLNSNGAANRWFLALGVLDEFTMPPHADPYSQLHQFYEAHTDWIFGYFAYELKNSGSIPLQSNNPNPQQWPPLRFYRPEIVVEGVGDSATVHFHAEKTQMAALAELEQLLNQSSDQYRGSEISFRALVSQSEYLSAVNQLKREIQTGNIYEINYCIPFEAEVKNLDLGGLYHSLNHLTEAPFSAYYSDDQHALICGSPERYLKKVGDKLTAQPIKGTCKRAEGAEDEMLRETLREDIKERAENIMITDLVRNDLSRVATPQSVQVEELCGVYPFKTVYQMISTITARLSEKYSLFDAIRHTFPMGSMTGAPKIRAMQLIDDVEVRQRGLYSGAFGYVAPNGDFDFNVVIRSLLYNRKNGLLGFQVGSAITDLSVPEKEYEECLLKAAAMLQATKSTTNAQ